MNIPSWNDIRYRASRTLNKLTPQPPPQIPANPEALFVGRNLVRAGVPTHEALQVQGHMNHGAPVGQAITHTILQSGGFSPAMKKAALLLGVDLAACCATEWLESRKVS